MLRNVTLPIFFFACVVQTSAQAERQAVAIFNGKDLTGWSVQAQEGEKEKAAKYWSVVDGAIQLETKGDRKHDYVWLRYDAEVADFELTLKVRTTRFTEGNSGIQIRSRYLPREAGGGKEGKGGSWLSGPQIDIHPQDPFRIGLIYDETAGVNRWIYPSKKSWEISWTDVSHLWLWRVLEKGGNYMLLTNAKGARVLSNPSLTEKEKKVGWNTIKIRAQGAVIKTWVNDLPVANFDGKKELTTAMHKKLKVGMSGKIFLQLHASDDVGMQFKDIQLLKLGSKK